MEKVGSSNRKSNIELLRILAMIMIVAHHVAVHSGFEFSSNMVTINKLWILFIQMGGKIGVDIFVLISGYFMISSKSLKLNKVIKLWIQIFGYSAILFLIDIFLLGDSFSVRGLITGLLPITYSKWWFASTYFVMFLLSPYLNRFFSGIDRKIYQKLLLLLALCWCIIPTFLSVGWQSNSLLWFIFLYALAGYFRLYLNIEKIKCGFCFIVTAVLILLTFASAVVFSVIGMKIPFFAEHCTHFYGMEQLPVVLISIFTFIGFLKLNIGYKSFINVIASSTFGVYLIHDNAYIRYFLWKDLFNNKEFMQSSWLIPYTILEIIIVFVGCATIELFRIYFIERHYIKAIDRFCGFVPKSFKSISELKFIKRTKQSLEELFVERK